MLMFFSKKISASLSPKLAQFISLPFLRAGYGLILALGAPLGWILVQQIAGREAFSTLYFDPLLYSYMTFATAVVFSLIGYRIGLREQVITNLALIDPLTALYNKRYFKNRLEQEFKRFKRNKSIRYALILIDLDFFKAINDTYGHQAGDSVLKSVSATIMGVCRENEIAARVGGEELCIIACGCDLAQAKHLADRIRKSIEHSHCTWQGECIKVTASLGISIAENTTENAWQIYQQADEAMYKAKQTGRNKVCVF